jgi:hypothetical protein
VACGGRPLGWPKASQNSPLGINTITCQGNATSASTPGLLSNSANSRLTVVFEIKSTMHYSLAGQIGGFPGLSSVRLTGPSGIVHDVTTSGPLDFCGTLAPGQYEIRSESSGSGGAGSNHSMTLRIVKPGDVNGDQLVNVDDLLGVINAWGVCSNPQNCPQDVTCNNAIDIDDLLAVINNWS